jgi:formyltetrahydrofolate deformylase
VSAISTFLAGAGANIVTLAQHSTAESGGALFQRTEFHLPCLPAAPDELERVFASQVAGRFGMEFTLTEAARPKRVAIMVSKTDHCILDLLWRNRRGGQESSRPEAAGPAAAVPAPACRARQYPAHAAAVPAEPLASS